MSDQYPLQLFLNAAMHLLFDGFRGLKAMKTRWSGRFDHAGHLAITSKDYHEL